MESPQTFLDITLQPLSFKKASNHLKIHQLQFLIFVSCERRWGGGGDNGSRNQRYSFPRITIYRMVGGGGVGGEGGRGRGRWRWRRAGTGILSAHSTSHCTPYRIFKLLRSPWIDSKESIPPAYVAWRAGTTTLFLPGVPGPIDCSTIPAQCAWHFRQFFMTPLFDYIYICMCSPFWISAQHPDPDLT